MCKFFIIGIQLKYVSEFNYLGYMLDEAGVDGTECRMKVSSGRKVGSPIRSLVNARSLQIEGVRMLHEALFMPVLLYVSETMVWSEKENSKRRETLRVFY